MLTNQDPATIMIPQMDMDKDVVHASPMLKNRKNRVGQWLHKLLKAVLRIRHFEFWNTHIFHLPIYLHWLYLSMRARSLFFFSAANPGIETGGLIGESKYRILQKIDHAYLPETLFYGTVPRAEQVLADMKSNNIHFPIVAKPDVGQGGWLVEMIHDYHELVIFLECIKMPFMFQQYVDDPLELGVLYYRFPGSTQGTVSSIAIKELLSITGDGCLSVRALMARHARAKTQLNKQLCNKKIDLGSVPARGEKVSLSFIANHSYGTMFINGNDLITDQLTACFDKLTANIDGFYFGRFDLRCKTRDDLAAGRFKILELNGVGSEPLHIFDPASRLFDAYVSSFHHWKVIYQISKMNKKAGVHYMKLREAIATYKYVRRIQRAHNVRITIGNA